MFNEIETLTRKQAAKIIAATFPNYKGRKIKLERTSSVTFSDTTWDGGSKNYYAAISIDGRSEVLDMTKVMPWSNPLEGRTFPLPTGCLLVEHTIFCGKDAGLHIYVNPASAGELALG